MTTTQRHDTLTDGTKTTRAFATDSGFDTALDLHLDADDGFSWDEVSIVQIDNPPHEAAFDTERFYKIPLTAARPVEQTYQTVDGDVTMLKPSTELEAAAWSLDNAPFTLGHPDSRIVDGVDKVHGFTRAPRWMADDEALRGDVYIPVTDIEAKSFIEDNDDISIGFWYNVDHNVNDEHNGVDAYQRDLLIDHVAAVDEGRCSREDGCGLGADATAVSSFHATVATDCSDGACSCGLHIDAEHEYDEGDWVAWTFDGARVVGRVTNVTSSGKLTTSEGGERTGTDNDPAYKMKHWDDGEFGNMVVKHESELESADTPSDFKSDSRGADSIGHDRPTEDRHWTEYDKIEVTHQMATEAITVNMATAHTDFYVAIHDEGAEYTRQNVSVGEQLGRTGPFDAHQEVDLDVPLDAPIAESRRVYAVLYYTTPTGDMAAPIETQNGFVFDSAVVMPDESDSNRVSIFDSISDTQVAQIINSTLTRLADDSDTQNTTTEIALDQSRTVAGVTFTGLREGDLDESEIPNDDFESHYLYPADTKSESSYPVVDGEGYLRRGNVDAAYQLGARGGVDADEHDRNVRRLNDVFANADGYSAPIDPESFTTDTMSQNTDDSGQSGDDGGITLDVSDLTIDALTEKHDGVDELKAERDEFEEELNALTDEMEAQRDVLLDELQALKEEVESYRADEKQNLVDEITTLTDTWDEDELMDLSLDTLTDRLELAKDIASGVSGTGTTGANTDSNDGDGGESTSEYTQGEVYDLSNTA